MKSLIKGYVEHVQPGVVVGWACDPAFPGKSVRIEARRQGKALARTLADITRDDLLELGIGQGRHGFKLTLPDDLHDELRRGDVTIYAATGDGATWQRLPSLFEVEQEVSFTNRILRELFRRRSSVDRGGADLLRGVETRVESSSGKAERTEISNPSEDLQFHSSLDEAVTYSSEPDPADPVVSEIPTTDQSTKNYGLFEVKGKLFGAIDTADAGLLEGWMLSTRGTTTPMVLVDGLPATRGEWPLLRQDVIEHYGVQKRAGFRFEFDAAPGKTAEIAAFDGKRLTEVTRVTLAEAESPKGGNLIRRLMEDAARPDAVAVTCWDGGHNPIGRAKVLYDVLDGARPVWLFSYLFDEFGGKLWAPLANSNLRIMTIPWKERERYHRMFETFGIKFPTIWMCKPRLPTLLLASALARPDSRLVLDLDDNEEHFSRSQGSVGKPYGGETIGLVRNLIEGVSARTAASQSLAEDYRAEIVRHARRTAQTQRNQDRPIKGQPLRIGFVGTVRPHKRILEAAQAIQIARHISDEPLEFCVHGDIRPEAYRNQLEANSAKTHGTVLTEELESVLQGFDVVLTGYPSIADEDEPITRYQITSKIGDALASGIPALVPRTRSVEDLEGTPGVFLFDTDNFVETLMKALRYSKKIKLPKAFTLEGGRAGFEAAEAKATRAASALASIAPPAMNKSERSVLLLWKQQDGGLYGRRIDQIARAIKLSEPETTVRVVEFMNTSVRRDIEARATSFMSDAGHLLTLADRKQSGNAASIEGVVYNQIEVKTDSDAANALIDFLWLNGHSPDNTLIVAFPAFPLLTHLASVIEPFPLLADIVDNQLSWGDNKNRSDLIAQYAWLMRSSRQVVFNSEANLSYFREANFLKGVPESRISVVPNWYIAPGGKHVQRGGQPNAGSGVVNAIYSGNLNDRIDWSLMERVAGSSDSVRLHIVGDGSRVAEKLRALMALDNVIYYGPLGEDQVSSLLQKMHFAIMPHLSDEVSTFMNPLKVLMYGAHGLRSVAVAVQGLNGIEGLSVCDTPEAFLAEVRRLTESALEGTLEPAGGAFEGNAENAETYMKIVRGAF